MAWSAQQGRNQYLLPVVIGRRRTDLGVLFEGEHDLRRAVPSRRDLFSHEARFRATWFRSPHGSRKTEIADLEIAICIQE